MNTAPGAASIDTVAIAGIVTVLVQFTKAAVPTDGYGPLYAVIWTILGVAIWTYSSSTVCCPVERESYFNLLGAFANVLTSAIGIYHGSSLVATGSSWPRRSPVPEAIAGDPPVVESSAPRQADGSDRRDPYAVRPEWIDHGRPLAPPEPDVNINTEMRSP
jgi:hypothetical protein